MRLQLKNESGVALVMAVGILAVLMVTGGSLIYYAGSNARSAEHSADDTKALALGEAGLNYARAILWNAADPTSASAVPSGTLSLEGGTVTYTGAYDSATKVWTLTGNGSYYNPTGPGTTLSRTVSSQVLVSSSGGMDPAWGYLFADTTSNCTNLTNFIVIDAPLYVRGDLCMENQATIISDLVRVRGKVQIKDSASIGTSTNYVNQVDVVGGCRYPWSGSYVTPCGTSQKVYKTNFSTNAGNITKPTVDLTYWYNNAKPGPKSTTCTSGSFPGQFDNDTTFNRSNGTQYLFPSSAYNCEVWVGGELVGRIGYTPGNPGSFYINGVVFFDGKLELQGNKNVVYSGRGSIYASDEIKVQNYITLCGIAGCGSSWDPNTNLLAFVAGATSDSGMLVENNTTFQGAIYVVNDYFQKNDVKVCGPVIAQELFIENGSQNCYVPFSSLAPGMPGTSGSTTVTLTNVANSFTTD
jgi:hypothetical protein